MIAAWASDELIKQYDAGDPSPWQAPSESCTDSRGPSSGMSPSSASDTQFSEIRFSA